MKKNSTTAHSKNHPITTVTQGRVPIFWPTNKPPRSKAACDLVIENDWGRATIKNCRLTQVHRNIIDLIFVHHHGLYSYKKDGSVGLLIDLYEIQKLLHIEETNYTWLFKKFDELQASKFITETEKWIISGGIVRRHSYSKTDADHTPNKYGDNRFYYVVIEPEFMKFFKLDIHIHYTPLVIDKIINLKNAVTQAFVRFCLTHRQVNAKLADILNKIGVFRPEMHKRQRSKIMKQILEETEVLMNNFGIEIRQMKSKELGVFYSQHKEVWFENPDVMGESKDK